MTESSIISTMFIYFDIDVLKEALIIYTINHLQQVEGMFICIQGRLWCTNWQGVFKVYVLYNQVKNTHFCNKNKLKKTPYYYYYYYYYQIDHARNWSL